MDPRQQSIKSFFQIKDAEELGKLESSDRLNLDADNAGLGGAAAGSESEAGPNQENVSIREAFNKNEEGVVSKDRGRAAVNEQESGSFGSFEGP